MMTDLTQIDNLDMNGSPWLSTYGMITAERILGTFHIRLSSKELAEALTNTRSIFNQFLKLPLQHVLNGIIMQQAHDYQVYVQKLYVDYLLSGEASKPVESLGGLTRESLEELRKEIIEYGDEFHRQENALQQAIASSQATLIASVTEWHKAVLGLKNYEPFKKLTEIKIFAILNALDSQNEALLDQEKLWTSLDSYLTKPLAKTDREKVVALIAPILSQANHIYDGLSQAIEEAESLHLSFQSYRTGFRDYILKVQELFHSLTEYHVDPLVDIINREPLYFDKDLS